MSEFLAEARVLVRPDTTAFRVELQAQLLAATRGVVVPIPITPIATGAGLTSFAAQSQVAAAALNEQRIATQLLGNETEKAASKTKPLIQSQEQLRRGGLATILSLAGVRGATLAASSSFLVGAAAVVAFAKSVQLAAGLQEELNVFRVTVQATADEMTRVRDESIALGRDIRLPAVSAGDAAQAMAQLAKAGLDVENSIAGARGVLQLAAAAQIDNATATELTASALNAFQLAGEDAVFVADLLTNAANEAQGSISDIGLALQQSAAAASVVGVSLEDTVGLLTLLARAGLRGSDAGTSLRVSLLRLINPTKEARQELDKLNINLRDAAGNVRPEVFFELQEALDGVSRAEADATRAIIFGNDGFRAASILGRETATSFNELEKSLQRQGAAAEQAGARAEGFSGQMSALQSNLETLGTQLGTAVLPPLELFVATINEFVQNANSAIGVAGDLAGEIKDVGTSAKDAIPFVDELGEALKETFLRGLDPTRRPRQAIKLLADVIRGSGDDISNTATEVENDVREMFAAFSQSGGLSSASALDKFVLSLDEMADGLAKGDAESQKLARRIRELIKELQTPTSFIVDLDLDFDESEIDTSTKKATNSVTEGFRNAGGAIAEVGLEWMRQLGLATVPAAGKVGSDTGDAFIKGFNDAQIRGQLQAQKTAVAQAQAFGETGLEELLAERDRIDKILSSDRRPVGPALEALFRERESVINQIVAINEAEASAKEAAANKIETAQDAADDRFLKALSGREARLQNAAIIAEGTKNLEDDIRTQIALRNFYRRSITEIKKTVKDAQAEAQAVAGAVRDLIRAKQDVRAAKEALKEALREERREERERLRESLSLDVQIAQATGNRSAEERARQAEIDQIKREIRMTREGSNQRKRLILELRQKQKELAELTGTSKETNKAAQEFFFSQLQAQQGFAANLMGNLITGPTAGLVGVPAPPSQGVRQAAAVQEGKAQTFPTSGQANTEISVLEKILMQLRILNGSYDSPEAITQKKSGLAIMDGIGGV